MKNEEEESPQEMMERLHPPFGLERTMVPMSEYDALREHVEKLKAENDGLHDAISKVWEALAIHEYTGKHISEHVLELREQNRKLVEALKAASLKVITKIREDYITSGMLYDEALVASREHHLVLQIEASISSVKQK